MASRYLLALDVGERRIGVAQADRQIGIAVPFDTLEVDGNEAAAIIEIILTHHIDRLIVGYPRNQQGEPTAQTAAVERFVARLGEVPVPIDYQDESLTSVLAEQRLKSQKKPYTKGDIDAMAACLILEDYMEHTS